MAISAKLAATEQNPYHPFSPRIQSFAHSHPPCTCAHARIFVAMKVHVYYIGKTTEAYLREGEAIYAARLKHYLPVTFEALPDIKKAGKLRPDQLKAKEGELILSRLRNDDGLILLDEGGKQLSSLDFAYWLDRQLQMPYRRLVFVVGGAFGFDDAVYARANGKLSLSCMTFSHQMIRLFFAEQLYRGMTILRGEKYHNS